MPKLAKKRFNGKTAEQAKTRDKPYEIRDAGFRGLILRVQPSGSKRFILELGRGKRVMLGDATVLTLGEWKEKATAIQAEHATGVDVVAKNKAASTLKSFVSGEYREWALQHQKDGEANVQRVLTACEPLMKHALDKLGQLHIERWKSDRLKAGIAPSTVNRDMQGLKSVLNRAVAWGVIATSPAKGIKRVRVEVEHRVRYLEPDERARLMAALTSRDQHRKESRESGNVFRLERNRKPLEAFTGPFTDYLHPLVLLTLNTGLRRTEALTLTWDQVRLTDNPALTVKASHSKSAKSRHIQLNNAAFTVLREWKKQGDGKGLVFSIGGERIKRIDTAWKNLCKEAEITGLNFHDLRHDFASQLVMNGVDLYTVRELMGHGSLEMTQRYAHLAPDRLQQAVRVLDGVK